jgi:nucleoside phosphorylase
MTTVGVLAPMPSEMKPVARAMALTRDGEFWCGAVGACDVVATRTGIGTERAANAANRLLDRGAIDHVVVVGIAGGLGRSKVGELLIPEVVVDKESRAEYAATPMGNAVASGRLVTHDDFDMTPSELHALAGDGFVAVDMETAAIGSVRAARRAVVCGARHQRSRRRHARRRDRSRESRRLAERRRLDPLSRHEAVADPAAPPARTRRRACSECGGERRDADVAHLDGS